MSVGLRGSGRYPPIQCRRPAVRRRTKSGPTRVSLDIYGMFIPLFLMARTKEFDEAEVLDRAVELFHARGFAHTSFSDLVESLGISRQSLYDTYGDKHTLFQTALKRYMERAVAGVQRKLENSGPVKEVLADLFDA